MSNLPREDDSQNVPRGSSKQKKYTANDNFTRLESRKDDSQKLEDEMASTKPLQPNNDTLKSGHTELKDSTDTKLNTDKLPETHTGSLGSHTDELSDHTDELDGRTDKLNGSMDVLREITKITDELSSQFDSKTNEQKNIEQMVKEIQEDPDHSDKFKENILKLIFYWKETQEDSENDEESED